MGRGNTSKQVELPCTMLESPPIPGFLRVRTALKSVAHWSADMVDISHDEIA